jgi:hypothetical protein
MKIRVLILVAGLVLATSAQAVCYRDGKPYPTGAHVGDFWCHADGTWKKFPPPRAQLLPRDVIVTRQA